MKVSRFFAILFVVRLMKDGKKKKGSIEANEWKKTRREKNTKNGILVRYFLENNTLIFDLFFGLNVIFN